MTSLDLPPLPEQPEFVNALSPNAKAAWNRQMRAYGDARAAAAVEGAALEFDRRDGGAGIGFYDPHEPAEIIRSWYAALRAELKKEQQP